MATISVAPFSPTYHSIQELSCNYNKVVIPDGFADLVASRIAEPDIVDQIIANLNVLNPDSLQQTATALLTQDISSMLAKLSHKITQAPTTGDTSFSSFTPDYSGFADIVHFDTVRIESYISFAMDANEISARCQVVFKNGLASWCYLLMMTITHPSY